MTNSILLFASIRLISFTAAFLFTQFDTDFLKIIRIHFVNQNSPKIFTPVMGGFFPPSRFSLLGPKEVLYERVPHYLLKVLHFSETFTRNYEFLANITRISMMKSLLRLLMLRCLVQVFDLIR